MPPLPALPLGVFATPGRVEVCFRRFHRSEGCVGRLGDVFDTLCATTDFPTIHSPVEVRWKGKGNVVGDYVRDIVAPLINDETARWVKKLYGKKKDNATQKSEL